MPKAITKNLASEDIEYEDFHAQPQVSFDIQKTLARLLAWNEQTERFVRLRADAAGRLIVSPGGAEEASFNIDVYTVSNVAQQILSYRTNRQRVRLLNCGSVTIYVGSSASVTNATGWPIAPGEEFIEDLYTGNLYAICYGGSPVLLVLDY